MAAPLVVVLACFACPGLVGRPWYVATYFAPAIGGFLLWLRERLRSPQPYSPVRGVLDGVVIVLCSLRMTAPLGPMSGHMLFFVYAGITTPTRIVRIVMTVLIIETTYIKLVMWGDGRSWLLGILTGMALGVPFAFSRSARYCVPGTEQSRCGTQ